MSRPEILLQRAEEAIAQGDIEIACEALEQYANWRAFGGAPAEGLDERFDALFGALLQAPLPPTDCATPGAP